MGFQFVHIEAYSRTAGKGKAGGRSMRQVIAEAIREEGACPHVESPSKPLIIHGKKLLEVEKIAEERADQAVDAAGRRFRKDGLCLLAGVVSFPDTMEDCKSNKVKMDEYLKWEKDVLKFLNKEYGDCLESVVRHEDEEHPHLHFYIVPKLDDGKRFSVDQVHCGRAAAAGKKAEGAKKGDQNQAYKEAMRAFQDRYFEAVGLRHGQARIGPGRRRLTREGWVAEQEMVKKMAISLETAREADKLAIIEKGKKYLSKVKNQADKEGKEIKRRMISDAKKEIKEIFAPVTKIGGWVQAALNAMTGKEKEIEIKAEDKYKRKFENKVGEIYEEIKKERNELEKTKSEKERLSKENRSLLEKNKELKLTINELSEDKKELIEKLYNNDDVKYIKRNEFR